MTKIYRVSQKKLNQLVLEKWPYDHWLTNKAYLSATVTNISKSYTYKMAVKINWHRCGTKLHHCHPMYRERKCADTTGTVLVPWTGHFHGRTCSICLCPPSFRLRIPRLDVVHPRLRAPGTWQCSLRYLFLQALSDVSKLYKMVKFSHIRCPALGPELIPVYRQSARRWREVNPAIDPAVGCHYFLPGLRLPP